MEILLTLGAVLLGWLVGGAIERGHLRSLRLREIRWRRIPVLTVREPPEAWKVLGCDLVSGSVVVSIDPWKALLAWLRGLVGGRLRSIESLLERARREAVLRMLETASAAGFHAVIGVRLEGAELGAEQGGSRGAVGIELIAFGTALRLERPPG
jgi:uncharacterized protein YbjQ (UPF0145 family)